MSRVILPGGNMASAETAPLIDATPASCKKVASHGTFASRSSDATPSPSNIEDGLPQVDDATLNRVSGDLSKPVVNMAVLAPALAIGLFLVGFDNTVTIATYGKIGSDLRALNSTGWIATSYFLTQTTFQPLCGRLSNIFGRKSCLLFAYTLFGLGCLGCGLARDITELSVARAIAGAGGGGMSALVSILVTDLVSLRDRGVWQGYISVVFSAGQAAGAPLGGFLADSIFGWRWVFLVQCPIALLAFISVYLVLNLPETDHSHWSTKISRIDFLGAFTLLLAVFLLLFGLDNGSNAGWSEKITAVSLSLATALFALFVFIEAKVAKDPFAPGHIIFNPPLLAAYGSNFFGFAGQMGVLFFIPLFFQAALGASATSSALALLPSTVFVLAGTVAGGFIMKRTCRFYWLNVTGYLLQLLGVVPMFLGVGYGLASVTIVGLCILQFGSNISTSTTLIAIIANAAPGDSAVAIACSYLFRSLGTTIGVSVATAAMQQMLRVNLAQELGGGANRAGEIEQKVRQSLDYIRTLDPEVSNIVRKCYVVATQWAFGPVVVFASLAIASSLFIREKRLDR
ncbi:major facilitator superfamily domain-containing protein [Astrocystis sublimbata]|nr:major facilitator superfamily domain-containing protein [Astrocystis sublimbata]